MNRPLALTIAPLIAPLSIVLLGPGCITDKVTGEKRFAPVPWSLEKEQALGDSAAPNFEQQFDGPYPDAAAQQYLGTVVKEMASHSVRKDDFDYKFEVLNSSTPNAFALPGGYVYITRGLLENLESEGQFVSVLGHELGHVEHQHSMLQENKTTSTMVLLALLGVGEDIVQKDPDQPNNVTALASSAAPIGLLYFSRDQETEADRRGVFFSHVMGYDPREGEKTFEYFARLEKESGGSTPEFLRTHPLNENRVAEIDRVIRAEHPEVLTKPPAQFRAPPGPSDRFVQIVASIRKNAAAYKKADQAASLVAQADKNPGALTKAQGLIDAARKELPGEPLFDVTAGEIQFAQGRGDKGRALFEKSLASQRQVTPGKEHWKPRFYLGLLEADAGKSKPAAEHLRRASELYPMNPVAAYYHARAEEKAGNGRGAAEAYRRVTALAPQHSTLHQKSAVRLQALQGGAASR